MSSISLKLLMLFWALNKVFLPLNGSIAVLFGYAIIAFSIILPLEILFLGSRTKRMPTIQLMVVLLFFVLLLAGMIFDFRNDQVQLNRDSVISLILFFGMFFAMMADEGKYQKIDLYVLFAINMFMSLVFIAYTILPFDFTYEYDKYGTPNFTLSMGNPNATSICVMFCIILLVLQIFMVSKMWRIIPLLMTVLLLNTLWLLQSRTAFACIVCFLLLALILKVRLKRKWFLCAFAVPPLFIPIQFYLEKFTDVSVNGKGLATGRQGLFTDYIETILNEPFQYLFSGAFGVHHLSNAHNSAFSLIVNFGLIGLFLFYAFWCMETKKMKFSHPGEQSRVAIVALFVFIVHSMAEASVMTGALGYGFMPILLVRLVKDSMIKKQIGKKEK